MKVFYIVLLCAGLVSASKFAVEENPFEIVFGFFKGLANGINQRENLVSLATCFNEGKPILDRYNELWEAIKKINPLDFSDFLRIIDLGTLAWHEAVLHVSKYPAIPQELLDLYEASIRSLLKSVLILCRIIVEPQEMLKWIIAFTNAVTYFDNGNALGHIIFEFVYNKDVPFDGNFSVENLAVIIETFFEQLVNKTTHDSIKDCLKQIIPYYKYFKEMLKEIMKITDTKELIEALSRLLKLALDWIKSISSCQCFPDVLMKMVQKFINVNPDDVNVRAKKNYNRIIADFADFIDAFRTKEYSKAGKGLGDVILILIYDGKVDLATT